MDGIRVFNQLLVGLNQQIRGNNILQNGNFSTILLQACNALVSQQSVSAPKTLTEWLHLFTNPVAAWWPADWQVPDSYDTTFSLLDGRYLSEEASSYLYDELLHQTEMLAQADSLMVNLALDNLPFKKLLNQLRVSHRTAVKSEADRIQKEYVQVRRFLIEHPFTTSIEITNRFKTNEHVLPQTVGDFYDDCALGQSIQVCTRCGPMRREGHQWRGLRPSVCDRHDLKITTTQRDSRQLKMGLQWRVCLPGLPEIRLFDALQALQVKHPKRLTDVSLWPTMDVYDIQLRFSDGDVWAVDVKDYRHAQQLAKKIGRLPVADELPHRLGFYVVPDHRVQRDRYYVERVREETKLEAGIEILSETDFTNRVGAKLRSRSKMGRS